MRYLRLIIFFVFFSGIIAISKSNAQVELVEFSSSECLEEQVFERNYINRILESEINKNFHFYEIFVVTNCSSASSGSLEVQNDTINLKYSRTPVESLVRRSERLVKEVNEIKGLDTLFIKTTIVEEVYEIMEEVSSCDCAFNFKYKIKGLKNRNYTITANEKLITKTKHKYKIVKTQPTFEIVENDTINFVDIYGLEQGLHISKTDKRIIYRFNFEYGQKISGYQNYYNFKEYNDKNDYEKFDRIEHHMKNGEFVLKKYYLDKKLVKVCESQGIMFEEGINCRYFN